MSDIQEVVGTVAQLDKLVEGSCTLLVGVAVVPVDKGMEVLLSWYLLC